jgi:nucleoside-diphosphate-sugar epimerase
MKIAVTGATGFIGRHVVAELDRLGLTATVLVRPSRETPTYLQRHRVVPHDIAETVPPQHAYACAGEPDVLLHLAWGGLADFRALEHFEREGPQHYRYLKSMVEGGLPRLLAVGTCLEYGRQSGALSETADTRPVCGYALGKDMLRRQLELLQSTRPFGLTWARLFYLHGEGQMARALWPSLRRAAEAGETSFPMSRGDQLRDYLPVRDAARHLVALALGSHCDGVVNVCSGRPVSVRALVESWIAANDWNIHLELGARPYADYEPMAFWGDRAKLDACLQSATARQPQSET